MSQSIEDLNQYKEENKDVEMLVEEDPSKIALENLGSYLIPTRADKSQPYDLAGTVESPALIYIIDKTGMVQNITNKFYLRSAQEKRQEVAQVIESFDIPSFYFFGEKTKMYQFSGQMLESESQDETDKHLWASKFKQLYEQKMRATKLAEQGNEILLTYANNRVYGYMTNLNFRTNANKLHYDSFSFSLIVRDHQYRNYEDNPYSFSDNQSVRNDIEKLFTGYQKKWEQFSEKFDKNLRKNTINLNFSRDKHIEWMKQNCSKKKGDFWKAFKDKFSSGKSSQFKKLLGVYKQSGAWSMLETFKELSDKVSKYNRGVTDE